MAEAGTATDGRRTPDRRPVLRRLLVLAGLSLGGTAGALIFAHAAHATDAPGRPGPTAITQRVAAPVTDRAATVLPPRVATAVRQPIDTARSATAGTTTAVRQTATTAVRRTATATRPVRALTTGVRSTAVPTTRTAIEQTTTPVREALRVPRLPRRALPDLPGNAIDPQARPVSTSPDHRAAPAPRTGPPAHQGPAEADAGTAQAPAAQPTPTDPRPAGSPAVLGPVAGDRTSTGARPARTGNSRAAAVSTATVATGDPDAPPSPPAPTRSAPTSHTAPQRAEAGGAQADLDCCTAGTAGVPQPAAGPGATPATRPRSTSAAPDTRPG